LGLGCLHLSLIGLAVWAGTGNPAWLAASGPLAAAGLIIGGREPTRVVAFAALLVAHLAAFSAELHLLHLARVWPERSAEREAEVQDLLAVALDDLLRQGETATAALTGLGEEVTLPTSPDLPETIRTEDLDAVALFGPSGELLAWDGIHQGPVPATARFAQSRYVYEQGPLFGYLYVTEPAPWGGTAVAASLLKSDLPPLLASVPSFESRFQEEAGATVEVATAEGAGEGRVWDLEWEDEVLLSVSLTPPSEAEARERVEFAWARFIAFLMLMAWGASVLRGADDPRSLAFGAVALPIVLVLLPLGDLAGRPQVFSPTSMLLPGPLELTLGDILAIGVGGALVLGILPWVPRKGIPLSLAAALGAVLATGALELLEGGASRDLLAGDTAGWMSAQLGATALVLLSFALATLPARSPAVLRGAVYAGSIAIAVALGFAWVAWIARFPASPWWAPLLWGVPLLGVALGLPAPTSWRSSALRWGSLTVLSVTLALPWALEARIAARKAVAEERVERLGTRPDPFLEFLLLRAGERAAVLAGATGDPVEVLYRVWTESGLAIEGFPLWVTYWSADGVAREELRIGVAEERPPVPEEVVTAAAETASVVVRRFDLAEVHYVSVAPLADGGLLSIVVPPRRLLGGASPLGPLFSPARGEPDPLVLMPVLPGEVPGETEGVTWIPVRQGWEGQSYVVYPDGLYHAHYRFESPGALLLVSRGSLILLFGLIAFGVPWAIGRWIGVGRPWDARSRLGALSSFRGRVTVALFGFFLIPVLAFGTLAYQTLSAAAMRTAESLAERVAEEAGAWYFEVNGAVDLLANRVGSDLLLYEGGELVGGSLPELVELGLYEGWIPTPVQEVMAAGEAVTTTATASLGGWDYVVAYRRMPGDLVLAAPAPLQAGATALGQRDVTDLIAFSVVFGGLLSVLLALAAGRALARPIQTLSVASERVGGGNMDVRLPEGRRDEFGAVFDAFNRMVDRLAETRKALVSESRRTRAIVEEVPTGVVALDPRGRVALASSRVENLLGTPLATGHPIPCGDRPDDPRTALSEWVAGYFRDELSEAGTELPFGDRRIRVRARRISRKGPLGGAVLTLEDVTDELRSERILAWGEMAQQVAHEVKNPLTPIKLGIQHIRRAWADDQPDYESILNHNVEVILHEIDRLAAVASSFSAYGAPSPAGPGPLQRVDVLEVSKEVLDLYAAGSGAIRFRLEEEGASPVVRARGDELKEVLVNLLENARAALPEGGEVIVRVKPVEQGVEIAVSDNGIGIAPELLPRIFEPHFSTRSGGTGLGLAIVRRLVESWGGSVHAESASGQGATIRIRVPTWG
jgi:signal transduction histidine kinase/HAMP domain-containing protein